MAEESCEEIEYLEEDADVVMQCVQTVQPDTPSSPVNNEVPLNPMLRPAQSPLLVERHQTQRKRKKTRTDDDSDYDPSEDLMPGSPPSPKTKKKKPQPTKKVITSLREVPNPYFKSTNRQEAQPVPAKKKFKEIVLDRKKCNIRIPDYDDPLCLPVRAIKQEKSDINRLNNWNNVCLEHFKNCDVLLKPERGSAHSSVRTMVFRNVQNKQSGQKETTIWSKTSVENEDGDRKSEIFQCVLPRYKEKKVLSMYGLGTKKQPKPYYLKDEVILCKEEGKEGDVLVAYKPNEATSSVYKLFGGPNSKIDLFDEDERLIEDDLKMYLKEIAHTKMCAPCYQTSWRGVKKIKKKEIACPVCARTFGTAYNLITHFKTHDSEDIRAHTNLISVILGEVIEYHYKCRICQEVCGSIKKLRKHVTKHQGNDTFLCEIGNHFTT